MKDPLGFWLDMNRNYGPVSYARLGWLDLYMVNEPELVEKVLVEPHRDAVKDLDAMRELVEFAGFGLITLQGDSGRIRRRLPNPALQPTRIGPYADTIVDYAERSAASFRENETRDFHRESLRLTLAIAARTLLGIGLGNENNRLGRIMETAVEYMSERSLTWRRFLPPELPTAAQRRFHGAINELDDMIYAVIARSRAQAEADHLLARLVQARREDGVEVLTDRQMRDEVVTALLAGHETTALTLTFAVYELARHPEVAERARVEIESQARGRRLSTNDLDQLPWLDSVVREALRLYPAGRALARRVERPVRLDRYQLKAGSLVAVSPYAMQRNPRWFPEPDRFKPERWLDGGTSLPRGCFIPFGDGPRVCVGSHYALAQLKLVLGTLLRRLDFRLADGYRLELAPKVALHPNGGLPVKLRRARLPAPPPQPQPAQPVNIAV